jgi:site-specific DNA recombinase
MKKRAIIYTRFSPRRNSDQSESCEIQLAICEQHAAKKGYEVAGIFHDKDVSGKDEFREVLWKAIESLEKGDVLLCFKRDRLARNLYLSEQINRAVLKNGATIEAVTGDVEGDTDEIVMIRQVLASISEYERKMMAKRTKFSMLQHQKNGKRMGRYAPYGWKIDPEDPSRLVEVDKEQEALARIKVLHAAGKNTCEIARAMNEEMGYLARGPKWVPKTIRKIISRF